MTLPINPVRHIARMLSDRQKHTLCALRRGEPLVTGTQYRSLSILRAKGLVVKPPPSEDLTPMGIAVADSILK